MNTRMCGAIHSEGIVCLRPIMYQEKCCSDDVYPHTGPHQHVDKDGLVTHRWKETRRIVDLPFDGYLPLEEESE